MSEQLSPSEEARGRLEPWWKPIELAQGQCWRYAVGPLTIYLQRHAGEWWLAPESAGETEDEFRLESGQVPGIPEELDYARYAFDRAPESFLLRPRLLDRPVVVHTSHAVNIPTDQRITFFISTPVCVSVAVQGDVELREIPVLRLSDTWFGPSTRVGELCYSARTQARNSRSEVPLRPHRAVTPVTIHNRSEQMLTIDKISLPVPFLAVYGRADGALWTDPLTLEHLPGEAMAKLRIGDQPPEGMTRADLLAPARDLPKKGGLVRAFVDMFSE
jgi:hypothetical protein